MKKCSYTQREAEILKSENPMKITDEEFLAIYNKAFHRDHLHYIIHLGSIYPDIKDRVFSEEYIENTTTQQTGSVIIYIRSCVRQTGILWVEYGT